MGKCYCDYCDVFLTNDSVAVRKQHNEGNRHKFNVCEYYRQYIGKQLQQQIDQIVQQFEINVANGLIRPTYGVPPAVKAHMVLQKAQENGDVPKHLDHPTENQPHIPQNASQALQQRTVPTQLSNNQSRSQATDTQSPVPVIEPK